MDYNRTTAVAAAAASAAALHFGMGLLPVWPLAWLFPLPILAVAFRSSKRMTFAVTLGAWAVGSLGFALFLHGRLRMPILLVAVLLLVPGLLFSGVVLLSRALLHRGTVWWAALAMPATWTALEFLSGLSSPHGTAGSFAYSQADVLPLVQLASVTGLAGITFLLMAVPSALAVMTYRTVTRRQRWAMTTTIVALVVAALAFGFTRLARPVDGPVVRVGLAASDVDVGAHRISDREQALRIVDRHAAAVDALAARGATLVVLPEKLVGVTEAYRADVERAFGEAAARGRVTLVAGVNGLGAPLRHNLALVFGPDGALTASYLKRHHIPGIEDGYKIGDATLLMTGTAPAWGVAICKDFDFPALGRENAARGAGLMLVPAWDFIDDAWTHDRMASLRAVESGFALARTAKNGLLTLRDDRGRLLAEARSDAAPVSTLVGAVRVRREPTVYARYGDWFGWLCVVATVAVLGRLIASRRRRPVA